MSPKTNKVRGWLVDLITIGVILSLGYLFLSVAFGGIRVFGMPWDFYAGLMVLLGLTALTPYLTRAMAKLK